jgi:hypothetical protein
VCSSDLEEVACFDENHEPAKLGNGAVVAIALQGVKSKLGNPREYYYADCFQVVSKSSMGSILNR